MPTRTDVLTLFHERLGVSPFNEMKGPNGSRFFFYQIGKRVVIVQSFGGGDHGWCEYIGTEHNSVDQSFADLKALQEEDK